MKGQWTMAEKLTLADFATAIQDEKEEDLVTEFRVDNFPEHLA
jgi:hypothetical protein